MLPHIVSCVVLLGLFSYDCREFGQPCCILSSHSKSFKLCRICYLLSLTAFVLDHFLVDELSSSI